MKIIARMTVSKTVVFALMPVPVPLNPLSSTLAVNDSPVTDSESDSMSTLKLCFPSSEAITLS